MAIIIAATPDCVIGVFRRHRFGDADQPERSLANSRWAHAAPRPKEARISGELDGMQHRASHGSWKTMAMWLLNPAWRRLEISRPRVDALPGWVAGDGERWRGIEWAHH